MLVGDNLLLQEYNSEDGYTGAEFRITYIISGGHFGIDKEYCVLGIINYKT